ncbi:hypothetical protein FH609_028605 [Streptomyces sp. 3MP-14]|uniref:CDP-glycerol--poly(Glycerophosphate) glycerophosphotransferase n=1 Tax=Streptomyces mimosae TaxID=2586635 RepID=A0A5N5ZUJ4_9ACTN|nr:MULTISPECIES: hypothetical protein [Streptomyces]KAB8159552.1 hypothetical protein FH607_028085 [Streptomyces mimosae]KAB8172830.1 hypothetical protein FH609_028605 [Streptomyces sp. 3MP-14]
MTDNSTCVEPALVQRGQWITVPDQKSVLAVVHTLVYAERLRRVVELVESDFRVQVVYTVAPHAFGAGLARSLEEQGVTVIPWEQAVRTRFDLALAAGSRGIHLLRAPVVRLPHGGGQIKLLRAAEGATEQELRVANMLSRQYLLHEGRVVPAALVLAHERDRETLARSCPEALPVTEVVGDPYYDRLLVSLARRAEYRAALGLRPGERLLVVTSTWGESSAFGRFDALLPRLLRELPPNVRTALFLHPNLHATYGSWQLHQWLGGQENRVRLAPTSEDWMPSLVACDWVLGDAGSVTSYATLTGRPILLSRFPVEEVAPDSSAALLARTAPALSPARPLAEQLAYAEETYDADGHRRVAARLTSRPGTFHRRMRTLLYRLLDLAEPAHRPVVRPAGLPARLAGWQRTRRGEAA